MDADAGTRGKTHAETRGRGDAGKEPLSRLRLRVSASPRPRVWLGGSDRVAASPRPRV